MIPASFTAIHSETPQINSKLFVVPIEVGGVVGFGQTRLQKQKTAVGARAVPPLFGRLHNRCGTLQGERQRGDNNPRTGITTT